MTCSFSVSPVDWWKWPQDIPPFSYTMSSFFIDFEKQRPKPSIHFFFPSDHKYREMENQGCKGPSKLQNLVVIRLTPFMYFQISNLCTFQENSFVHTYQIFLIKSLGVHGTDKRRLSLEGLLQEPLCSKTNWERSVHRKRQWGNDTVRYIRWPVWYGGV